MYKIFGVYFWKQMLRVTGLRDELLVVSSLRSTAKGPQFMQHVFGDAVPVVRETFSQFVFGTLFL